MTYPDPTYPLSTYADLMGITPKTAREAAEKKLIPGAFRPYDGAHWRISGAALNDIVAKLKRGTKAGNQDRAVARKRRAQSVEHVK